MESERDTAAENYSEGGTIKWMQCGKRQEETETKRGSDMWLIDISAVRCWV